MIDIYSQNISNLSGLVSNLSIFLFIIAANFATDIYSCSLRHIFTEYMFIKHILGFFIMLFFVGLVRENKSNIQTKILESLILYFWFIFIMRAPTIITIITIFIICTIYLINLYIQDIENKLIENKEINEDNSRDIEFYKNLTNILFVVSFLFSIIGTIIYIITLKNNHGNKFSIYFFLLGKKDSDCLTKENHKKFKKHGILFDLKK